ncbi:hypothetical protein F4861DRAFT_18886 [Xylaria intraflava]|nr:hypothetical protein F4861DRAFT_18886 [Xylaria intraflava]
MSASAPQMPNASPDITYLTPEPFEPKPLIADILRTRFCVPDSIFLIEGVDVAHTSKSKRWRAVRLLLGDGELCIQALLSAEMHRFVDRGEITFGSYVRLQRFSLEWKEVATLESVPPRDSGTSGDSTGDNGEMVYLIVESLVVVGWNNTLTDSADGPESQVQEARPSQLRPVESEQAKSSHQVLGPRSEAEELRELVDIDEDDFEVMTISGDKTAHNRQEAATEIANRGRDATTSPHDLSL